MTDAKKYPRSPFGTVKIPTPEEIREAELEMQAFNSNKHAVYESVVDFLVKDERYLSHIIYRGAHKSMWIPVYLPETDETVLQMCRFTKQGVIYFPTYTADDFSQRTLEDIKEGKEQPEPRCLEGEFVRLTADEYEIINKADYYERLEKLKSDMPWVEKEDEDKERCNNT